MKKIPIICLSMLLLISQALHAQYIPEYDSALRFHVLSNTFEAAVSTHQQVVNSDTGEGGEANAFRRWVEWADNRRSLGAAEGEDIFWPFSMESMSYIENPGFYCIGSSTVTPHWKCIGPYVNYYYSNSTSVEYAGRVDFVWCDEDDQAHILASANTGGLWETHDTGHKWKCITDNATIGIGFTKIPGTVGITYLAVNPQNNNNIFLQLGVSGSTGVSYGYNMGLMFTENGGASWQLDTFYRHILGAGPTAGYADRGAVKYLPSTNRLFAFNGKRLLVKNGTGYGPWTAIAMPSLPTKFSFSDMGFSSGNNKVILAGNRLSGEHAKMCVYDTLADTWSVHNLTLPSSSDTVDAVQSLSVSGLDTVFMVIWGHNATASFRYLVKTSLSSGLLNVVNTDANFRMVIVSPLNQNIIYAAHPIYQFSKSTNGGYIFSTIHGQGHDDKRGLTLYKPTIDGTGDILLAGTDGGIRMKKYGASNFTSITGDSLCIMQFYSLSNSEVDDKIIIGGSQDNGGITYIKDRTPQWKKESSLDGDNFLSQFSRYEAKDAYINKNFPQLNSVKFSGSSLTSVTIQNPNDIQVHSVGFENIYNPANNVGRPIYFDENDSAYVGYRFVWKKSLSADNWNTAFRSHPIDSINGPKVCDMVVADNTGLNTAYIAYKDPGNADLPVTHQINRKLYYTYNANTSIPDWRNITDTNLIKYGRINDIEIDPNMAARIWVAYGDMLWSLTPERSSIYD